MLQHHMSKILTVHSLLCPIHLHFALFDLPSVTCNITVYSQHNSQPHVWHFTSDSHIHYILHTNFKKRHVQNKSFVLWGSEGYTGSVLFRAWITFFYSLSCTSLMCLTFVSLYKSAFYKGIPLTDHYDLLGINQGMVIWVNKMLLLW